MNSKKNLKRNLLICLLAGSAVMYTLPLHAATSVIGNNTLPQNGQFVGGSAAGSIVQKGDLQLDVSQKYQNAVIKWDSFDVGGSATVNFSAEGAYANNFNTLNYINSGAASQIYGTINASGGNIYIVNPAGVQIGNSAQINVGSLHVSNKNLDDAINKLFDDASKDETGNFYQTIGLPSELMANSTNTDAVLMSLGNINASNVTFEGDGRIVIDSERIKDEAGNNKLDYKNINITTSADNTDNIIIGYDAYDETIINGSVVGYANKNTDDAIATVTTENGTSEYTKAYGYMWVEDVEQLQAINTNLSGNYALRNSIDATATSSWNNNEGFKQIGTEINNAFTGKFDGLDYNIFGLTIKNGGENTGLFGYTNNATISNVTLVGGSITGKDNVGAIVGSANNTTLTNVVNSAAVSGNSNVGGIVGSATNSAIKDAINTGTINGSGDNVGGLIGNLQDSKFIEATDITEEVEKGLIGNSYNLGDVSGKGHNVGGLVGHAVNSTIGDGTNLVYNRLDVTGAYNVGGIVGNMEGTAVQNAENSGNVLATGYRTEDYIYHTGETNKSNIPNNGSLNNGVVSVNVNVANVGGIAGKADDTVKADGTVDKKSEIKNVTNSGKVSSSKQAGNDYYDAGNVGGIVGSAVDTNITNATNKENEVRGAHNVGGVAGYFGNSNDNNDIKYTINRGINDGGDIMATGARKGSSFVTEIIRPVNKNQTEKFIIGNIGGIAGYMDGDNVYITGSGNRGTVHTDEPADPIKVKEWQKAANVGGVVGKIDRSDTKKLDANNNIVDANRNLAQAAVSDSYNTGDVLGYTGIGGIAGLMYNGEIASSYNLGYLRSTRQSHVGPAEGNTEVVDALNMGGIVGDTTEESNAKALLYDVYNKGQIGDKEFNYFGRHVGGVVGRLSGTVEKAYNTGAIYNGYNVVGGIAGWVAAGTIQNAFNTGNITVYNQNESTSQVGGIAGAANGGGNVLINNVYNLGTLRSFDIGYGKNAVAGILGTASGTGTVTIKNAYTTGNLYSGVKVSNNSFVEDMDSIDADNGINRKVSSMYASTEWDANVVASHNTYYIKPAYENGQPLFTELTGDRNNANKAIDFTDKDNSKNYEFDDGITSPDKTNGSVNENSAWRIYDGNTPILNAFLPKAEDYFSGETGKENAMDGIGSIQYGTAYDPLLTIIKANGQKDNLSYSWEDLGIDNAAGIAVYGAGLTLGDFKATGGSGYFGGTIYADGALNINGTENINIGSAADIYGSAVNITTDGKVTIYGDVTATGNATNGVDDSEMNVQDAGDITINAGDVDVYGKLTSASDTKGATVTIPGIEGSAVTWKPGTIDDPYESMADIADRFAHTTGESKVDGNITINAGTKLVVDKNGKPVLDENGKEQYTNIGDGNVNLYYGNKGEGLITTGGDLTVTGRGNVYVDSDLDIKGNMTLTSTGKDSEVLLTLTNIGKVQADRVMNVIEEAINGVDLSVDNLSDIIFNAVDASGVDNKFNKADADKVAEYLKNYSNNKIQALEQLNDDISVAYMHDFMHSFGEGNDNYIALNAASGDAKLSVDMWVENSDGSGSFNFNKYDYNLTGLGEDHTFIDELEALKFYVNEKDIGNKDKIADASKYVYVEVHNGEQLKGIQNYVKSGVENASDALGFNYALMGDINASDVENYEAIGTGSEFTGTFDGRGNRIIGLNVNATDKVNNKTNAGIFSTIGNGGTVKNVNIYSGNFTGTETAGAVAGTNNGRIENVVTFGNTVTSNGNAGGIVGINNSGEFKGNNLTGGIYNVESTGSVIAGENSIAGGLVGKNNGGIDYSTSDSAVTAAAGTNAGLGGVVGVNGENGVVHYVDSLGVTNGGDTNSSNIGGIIGINNGNMYSGYNESIVTGNDNVGGIIGTNEGIYNENDKKWTTGTVENVVNATSVTSEAADSENIGGLVGTNIGSVTNGRNNGTITGNTNVGGLVGNNGEDAVLTDLVNAEAADITGIINVGGIAGSNAGEITTGNVNTDEEVNLINRGSITGQQYVGGVAGSNSGTITNANNDVELNVKDSTADAKYFGGIAGVNTGTINNATNTADVNADGAAYVGGIVGKNDGTLKDMAGNSGNVTGKYYVGGVAGLNTNNQPLDGVEASNTGTVFATNGSAGGIFAVNNANITNSKLTNNGAVIGNSGNGTGGIFGVNTGNISTSSLINEVDGQVIGTNNVGGLIGKNTGTIIGGRDDADSYYKYKIYNNGVINVGTWTDSDGDGVVDVNTNEFTAKAGQNIGGLIGNNAKEIVNGVEQTGSLTAGYNTGAINASGSTNVGGIAGSNSGTIDQVFNTIMVADGALDLNGKTQSVAVTGGTIVGGLVGDNTGTITNAYNTSNVVATNQDGIVGNLVGTNSGTVQYVYGYGVDSIDELIGEITGKGSISHGHAIGAVENSWFQQDVYEYFTFGANGWKIYNGSTLPMLSVFLTKVTVVDQHLVNQYFSAKHYGEFHQITADDIKALIAIGAISAPDGFGAFNNNNGLIQGVADDAMANSGNWLYSWQIGSSNINGLFNPNNLGYDISLVYSPFELDNDPSSHWNYLFNDAPFDRNKDFRERKAEVNFVDGGMEI
jgi:hypothetical protein